MTIVKNKFSKKCIPFFVHFLGIPFFCVMVILAMKNNSHALVKLEPIIEIIRAALWTSHLDGEQPVSLMLVAKQESAKTAAMKSFFGTPGIRYFSDITGNGIMKYKDEIESRKLRHFMLNDLTRVLSHGKGVGARTLQTLATLMEEGESETASPDGRITWSDWPKIGVIMGITPEFYAAHVRAWNKTGFMSRFLSVKFHYKESTAEEIRDNIRRGMKMPPPVPIRYKDDKQVRVLVPMTPGLLLQKQSKLLGESHGTYGFRYMKSIFRLAMAEAAIHGRNTVTVKDAEKVIRWCDYFGGEEVVL